MKTIWKIIAGLLFILVFTIASVSAESPKEINRRGVKYGEKHRYHRAVIEFNKAISKYNKSSAKVLHNRGYAEELRGNISKAIDNYKEALHRNPRQILTGEKLGFLYFKTGDYENAVKIGEHVLLIAPNNREVSKWLADAYVRRLQLRKFNKLNKKISEKNESKNKQDKKRMKEDKKLKDSTILYITFDAMLRTGYYYADKKYKLVNNEGLIPYINDSLNIVFTPIKAWEFKAKIGNYYLGALTPNLNYHSEKIEAIYKFSYYKLGVGIMLNHYKNDVSFGADKYLFDYKIGVLFGYHKDRSDIEVGLYPRLILFDGSWNKEITYDCAHLYFKYTRIFDSTLKYYTILSAKDFYLINHDTTRSDYWGAYEIGLGVTLGRFVKVVKETNFIFNIQFIERIYLQNVDNSKPYAYLPNGQGWFGMDMNKWVKGDPFSGFRTLGHELSFRLDVQFLKNFFAYKRILFELGNLNDHFELNFVLGAGVIF